jgi:hypothetical protein
MTDKRCRFVRDLARWRYFLSPDQQQVFDIATSVLWQFDPSECESSTLVQPDELLLSFQDFVRQYIPTISKQSPRPENRDMPYRGEELHALFEESNGHRGAPSVEGRGGSLGGSGSGELPPLEFLDPPCSDESCTTLEQGLDVLASLDILQDNSMDSEPDGSSPPGMFVAVIPVDDQTDEGEHENTSTEPGDTSSALAILLLASVAIGLAILALLGTQFRFPSAPR